ncbi:MAG: DivIVA domain-containing protein [Desulfobulbaceae bacterium]|nr:DivIVA domain-containing protein [Desulfobulbaceae bacterium]
MLTPQSIKDQEFQTKFRGYEPIEVKAYLELLAEDFFELTEKNRVQAEEIEDLLAEQDSLQKAKEALAAEVKISQENAEGIQEEIQDGYKHKDQEIIELSEQLESMSTSIAALEEENTTYLEKITALEATLAGGEGAILQDQAEIEKLRGRIELLEEQNSELKQEGVDFKTTILAAQKFADNLRQTSQDDARKIMDDAHAEIEKYRAEAEAELARLPKEIEELHQRKIQVRKDLETTLYSYLEDLEDSPSSLVGEKEDDLSDLFQSIQLPDGESVDPEEIAKIDMDLP